MAHQSRRYSISSLQLFSRYAAFAVVVIGLLVLVGWITNIDALKGLVPGTVTMKANTAICLTLAGLALLVTTSQALPPRSRLIAQLCAGGVVLAALLVLGQYVFGYDLGIDQLLFKEPLGAVGTYNPGRMAPNTAFNFILDGIAILLLLRGSSSGYRWAQVLSLTTALVALLALIGYANNITSFLGVGFYTQMAVNTSLAFILLSSSLLLAHPDKGLMTVISSPHAGGVMARHLALAVVVVPLALGLLIDAGHNTGLYSEQVGTSLIIVTSVLVLLLLVWFNAASLNRTDVEREQAWESLRVAGEQFQALVHNLPNGSVLLFDRDLTILAIGGSTLSALGRSSQDYVGKSIYEAFTPDVVNQVAPAYLAALQGQTTVAELADGDKVFEVHYVPITGEEGVVTGGVVMSQDITERKIAERKLEENVACQAELLRQLTTAQEAERRRLAMDLHDGPLQSLAVSVMALDRSRARFERGEWDLAEKERQFAREVMNSIIRDVRAVLADLGSELLAEGGLSLALRRHVETISEASDISIKVDNRLETRLPLEIETLLYRLAQEALANARKHSGASEIAVTVGNATTKEGNGVSLLVKDNGNGFDIGEGLKRHGNGSGLGLRSMEQRINGAGGKMHIRSQAGQGTAIEFWYPFDNM